MSLIARSGIRMGRQNLGWKWRITIGSALRDVINTVHRHELTDAEWKRIEALLPPRPGPRSRRGKRDFINASAEIIEAIRAKGMKPVIAANPTHQGRPRIDRKLHGLRYMTECSFHGLKRCRAVATRHQKTATNCLAIVHVACILAWLNQGHPSAPRGRPWSRAGSPGR